MKKILLLVLCLLALGAGTVVLARGKQKMQLVSVTRKVNIISFTVAASQPFIVGGNVYVLHIDDRTFAHNTQSVEGGKHLMSFPMGDDDFNALADGAPIYLTYGNLQTTVPQSLKTLSEKSPNRCWYLGTFKQTMLR